MSNINNQKSLRLFSSTASNGFTMVELVLVVGVLVVLSAVVLVTMNVPQYRGQAHNVQRKTDIKSIHNGFLLMARDKDDYTSGLPTSPACIGTGSANAFNLKGISWTANPSSTQMKFNVRACPDLVCTGITEWGPDYSSPTSIDISNASFFQYKAAFTDASELAWTQPTDEPFNGTNASTTVFGNSIGLSTAFDNGTGANGDFDSATYNGSSLTGITGTFPTITINTSNVANTNPATSPYRDTTVTPNVVVYNFNNFYIRSGHTMNVTGSFSLILKATGNVTVESTGILSLNGGNASNSTLGAGNAGGGNGSTGTTGNGANGTGVGPGSIGGGNGGAGTLSSCLSGTINCTGQAGGGGGFASTGGGGQTSTAGGSSYGDPNLSILYGGSGGGAGAGKVASLSGIGGGGGGGGGGIRISTKGTITVDGTIRANGGYGGAGTDGGIFICGADDNSCRRKGGGGGGGAGGSIHLQGNTINITSANALSATSGSGNGTYSAGGNGSVGRIRLDYAVKTGAGTTNPAAGYTVCPSGCTTASGLFTDSGVYISLPHDLSGQSTFKSIPWNRTDTKDGEITLGDSALKGLWHINEGSGTNVKDSAGSNTGTMNSASWGNPGKFGGKSFSLNGTKNITTGGSPVGLDIGASDGSWTLEAWVKPAATGVGTIISKDGTAMHYYDLKLNASNQVVAGLYDSGGDQVVATSATALSVGNWHHIAAIFIKSGSTGNVQIYINGAKDGGPGSNLALPLNMSNTAAFRVGMRNDDTVGFNGEIDEVAVWSKALSAPASDCAVNEVKYSYDAYQYEICQHFNKSIGMPHLKFQARSCDDALCDTETFAGPDGTAATYYNSIGNYGSNSSLNLPANQWVQYKAYFATSDSSVTPSSDSISIKYSAIQISKPKLEDVTITASLDSAGKNQVNLLYSGYGDFVGSGTNLGQINPPDSLKILDSGSIEYQGGSNPEYISPVFSTQCFDIAPVLVPEYLPVVPKDPKIGTDQNTGYFFSANPEMGTVTISAPAAELGEIIRN